MLQCLRGNGTPFPLTMGDVSNNRFTNYVTKVFMTLTAKMDCSEFRQSSWWIEMVFMWSWNVSSLCSPCFRTRNTFTKPLYMCRTVEDDDDPKQSFPWKYMFFQKHSKSSPVYRVASRFFPSAYCHSLLNYWKEIMSIGLFVWSTNV